MSKIDEDALLMACQAASPHGFVSGVQLRAAIEADEAAKTNQPSNGEALMTCPFCAESDYDEQGLKSHLTNDCEVFDAIPGTNQLGSTVREPEQPDDCAAIAEKALLLAARWFKLYLDDKTRYEHPASTADLTSMFNEMQKAREASSNRRPRRISGANISY